MNYQPKPWGITCPYPIAGSITSTGSKSTSEPYWKLFLSIFGHYTWPMSKSHWQSSSSQIVWHPAVEREPPKSAELVCPAQLGVCRDFGCWVKKNYRYNRRVREWALDTYCIAQPCVCVLFPIVQLQNHGHLNELRHAGPEKRGGSKHICFISVSTEFCKIQMLSPWGCGVLLWPWGLADDHTLPVAR